MPVLCWLLPFSLCTVAPLTIREHLSSLRLLWKGPHRHTQKCISQVTSNRVMVTVEIIVISVIVFSSFKPVSHSSQPFFPPHPIYFKHQATGPPQWPSPMQPLIQQNHRSVVSLSVFCPSVLVCRLLCGL